MRFGYVFRGADGGRRVFILSAAARRYPACRDFSSSLSRPVLDTPQVEVFCKKIHRQLINDFKYGWVWGKSVKFNPQKVGKAHVLMDEDVIQIVKKI